MPRLRRPRRLLLSLAATVVAAAIAPSSVAASPVNDLLPDLRVAPITQFAVSVTASGRRLLRFSSTMINVGRGPFVISGHRASTSVAEMSASQRIYTDHGTSWLLPTRAKMVYAVGDGHNHWHVARIARYELKPRANLAATALRGAKVGFCFFDTNAYNLSLPRAPSSRHYSGASCATRSSLSASMGLSVGWGDKYPWNFAYQWIDMTGKPVGDYRVCVTADPDDWFAEVEQLNNHTWADVHIGYSTVSVIRRGTSRCW